MKIIVILITYYISTDVKRKINKTIPQTIYSFKLE
jgi:hypothetical protein